MWQHLKTLGSEAAHIEDLLIWGGMTPDIRPSRRLKPTYARGSFARKRAQVSQDSYADRPNCQLGLFAGFPTQRVCFRLCPGFFQRRLFGDYGWNFLGGMETSCPECRRRVQRLGRFLSACVTSPKMVSFQLYAWKMGHPWRRLGPFHVLNK